MNILLTGYSGFVGKELLNKLTDYNVHLLGRNKSFIAELESDINYTNLDINSSTNYANSLENIEAVIHCAGRAHIMNDSEDDPLAAFREVNTFGTINLAQQAAQAGVKRFIFISSIKVNGEGTEIGYPFTAEVNEAPTDPYGLSKYEAEKGLLAIAEETGMEVVIIRPPLIYGPGVKANFKSMLTLVSKGIPLPFGGIRGNLRSLVSLDNLIDLILTCIKHPNAANQVFLVSDDKDISTADMFKNLAFAFNRTNRLLPIPAIFFKLSLSLIGKSKVYQRLGGSLQVDISDTCRKLDWKPPVTLKDGFAKTARYFLNKD